MFDIETLLALFDIGINEEQKQNKDKNDAEKNGGLINFGEDEEQALGEEAEQR